jgi:sigma-B regulation protein RsbU (phosphoserine phosphatase)
VGGDWYDFIPLDDGRWGLVLADVSGKGTAAALLMSATRGMLRSLAETNYGPQEVLTRLNRLLVDDFPRGRYVTMIYAVLDPASRTLTFSNAGHLLPLLVDGEKVHCLSTEKGMPLGLGFSSFSEVEVQIPQGSRLVFYSDGSTEAENAKDEEYGRERLENHLLKPEASAESVLQDVRSFASGAGLRDDATIIFVKA